MTADPSKPAEGDPDGAAGRPAGRCPICRNTTDRDYRPFCSKRCADIDLGRWLGGRYVIAEENAGDDDRSPLTPANDDEDDPTPRA